MLQLFSEIHDRSIVYNGKNLIENAPPPPFFLTFPKIHPFCKGKASLTTQQFRQITRFIFQTFHQ